MSWLHLTGRRWYDLGGISPETSPGPYRFRTWFGGREVALVGTYEYCRSPASRTVVQLGLAARAVGRRVAVHRRGRALRDGVARPTGDCAHDGEARRDDGG